MSETFFGARLRIARTLAGRSLEELGELVASSPSLLSRYEKGGVRQPSPDLVGALAQALNVRTGYFFRPLEDEWLEPECSFRRYKSAPKVATKRARAYGTVITLIVDELRGFFRIPSLNVPFMPGVDPCEIEAAADECRRLWGLGWGPISQVGRVAERNGMLLCQASLDPKIDAFSRRGLHTSVIVLNGERDAASRQIFDVAHEIGHFVLHKGVQTGSKETEEQANAFAAAFLLPKKSFAVEFRSAGRRDVAALFELKRRWNTSAQAIARRALDLGLMDPISYRRFYRVMSKNKWVHREPYEPDFAGPEWLSSALNSAVGVSTWEMCERLQITPQMFQTLTGVPVEPPRTSLRLA